MASLKDRGVAIKLNTRVAQVESPTLVKVFQKDIGPEQLDEINCGIIVWAAGTAPVPLTERLLEKLPKKTLPIQGPYRGRIPVDPWLRVVGSPPGTLFALGDASMIVSQEDDGQEQQNYILPQTAQVAAQQGAYMARLLNRKYCLSGLLLGNDSHGGSLLSSRAGPPIHIAAKDGDLSSTLRLRGSVEAKPFRFLNLGLLAFLGGGEALSQIEFGKYKLNEAGSTGFLLWRSVYIVKQVSTRTRVLVLFDWLKCKLFGRDVTRL